MVGVIYWSPSQNSFLQNSKQNLPAIDTGAKEICIFGDFNWNMYENSKYIVQESKTVCTKFTSADS